VIGQPRHATVAIVAAAQVDSMMLPVGGANSLAVDNRARIIALAHPQRIELTPEPEDEPALVLAPSRRRVLEPMGKPFDAAKATRSERDAQARRRKGG
jgi:hypothetical protein